MSIFKNWKDDSEYCDLSALAWLIHWTCTWYMEQMVGEDTLIWEPTKCYHLQLPWYSHNNTNSWAHALEIFCNNDNKWPLPFPYKVYQILIPWKSRQLMMTCRHKTANRPNKVRVVKTRTLGGFSRSSDTNDCSESVSGRSSSSRRYNGELMLRRGGEDGQLAGAELSDSWPLLRPSELTSEERPVTDEGKRSSHLVLYQSPGKFLESRTSRDSLYFLPLVKNMY